MAAALAVMAMEMGSFSRKATVDGEAGRLVGVWLGGLHVDGGVPRTELLKVVTGVGRGGTLWGHRGRGTNLRGIDSARIRTPTFREVRYFR